MLLHRWLFIAVAFCATAARPAGDDARTRPFVRPGEEIAYTVHSSRFGNIGRAVLRVEADSIYGAPSYRLSFDFSARIALFKVSDHTRSWLDARTLRTLHFTKQEQSPLGGRKEDVRISDDVATDLPLDELSFIYFVRALDLAPGDSVVVNRHFDPERNPVRIHAIASHQYEMTVPDARQKKGFSRLRFVISDDSTRVPLRIETSMPVAGNITMTLQTVR
jgi:hypothetical protein